MSSLQSASSNASSSGASLSTATTATTKGEKDAKAAKIVAGFKIVDMNMRDCSTGEMVWQSGNWKKTFAEELKVEVPASILQLKAVSREMTFSSIEQIEDFHLVQQVYLSNTMLEEWRFKFGFVIPNSTNTWQCVIEAAGGEQMLPASLLSGNTTIVTHFFDGDQLVSKTTLRVYYVEKEKEKEKEKASDSNSKV
eukprot:TRINITY_DN1830_c0_g3_i1.p1 TRINITY_DN1830_c0_g3~~TRINITY_DN1830_c0_g3_i1.p1  ORF type:complete len:195 (-),score=53.48 TRINITY_DN1830_c0_g3_i1:328-912(-)